MYSFIIMVQVKFNLAPHQISLVPHIIESHMPMISLSDRERDWYWLCGRYTGTVWVYVQYYGCKSTRTNMYRYIPILESP